MATYVDQPYYGWSHEEQTNQDDSQEVSTAQMLDRGSISFGRFAYEPLSWEKRSVFTFNKCQEELEKFKSPGLVAKKKAYFEEYYKKIRAMKASESQQTELTLEYGGDGSVSSQTGEEDETTMQLKNHSEEVPVEVSEKKDRECGEAIEIQIRQYDTESLRNNSEELQEEDRTRYTNQTQHLDMGTTVHGSLEVPCEEPNQHNPSIFDDKSSYPDQMQHLDMEIRVQASLKVTCDEPQQHDHSVIDDNELSRESSSLVTVSEPEVASSEITSCPNNSKSEDLKLKADRKMVAGKVIPSVVRKYKDHASSAKLKEPCGPARTSLKLESKSKTSILPSMRDLKTPIQKNTLQTKHSVGSCKTTPDKMPKNCKPTPRNSDRPLTEVHVNITVPRPFSFATDRRAATPSRSTDGARRSVSKPSNQPPPAINAKNMINIQGTSKRRLEANGMTNKGLENRRSHDGRRKPLTMEDQCGSFNARGANIPGPVKARSMNHSSHGKFSTNSGTDIRFNNAVREAKHKELRNEPRMREIQRADTKAVISSLSAIKLKTEPKKVRNEHRMREIERADTKAVVSSLSAIKVKTEPKKVIQSWTGNSVLSGRRLQFGEQSLDGKKLRQEKPRWR